MDMETVEPRTCQLCYGAGYLYWGNEDIFDAELCDCQTKEISNGKV